MGRQGKFNGVVSTVGLAALDVAAKTIFAGVGWFAAAAPVIAAAGLLTVALCIACGKPVSSKTLRIACAVLAIPLSVLTASRIWDVMPNAVTGQKTVVGFVCRNQSEEPFAGGTVEVLDRAGTVISTRGERINDRGFLFADLRPWALAPHSIRARGGPCSSAQVLPLDTAAGSGQCASASRGPETLQRFPHWSIGCDSVK